MMLVDFNSVAMLSIRSLDYPCIINEISKSEPKNLLKNAYLNEKSQFFKNVEIVNILISDKAFSGERYNRYFIAYMNDD